MCIQNDIRIIGRSRVVLGSVAVPQNVTVAIPANPNRHVIYLRYIGTGTANHGPDPAAGPVVLGGIGNGGFSNFNIQQHGAYVTGAIYINNTTGSGVMYFGESVLIDPPTDHAEFINEFADLLARRLRAGL